VYFSTKCIEFEPRSQWTNFFEFFDTLVLNHRITRRLIFLELHGFLCGIDLQHLLGYQYSLYRDNNQLYNHRIFRGTV